MQADALQAFDGFPDEARLWLAAFPRPLLPEEQASLHSRFEAFQPHWKTHGDAIDSAFALLDGQVLVVAERTMLTQPSGCAIDAMLRQIYKLADHLALPVLDAQKILVRAGGGLSVIPKTKIEALLQAGELGPDTPVLDLTLLHLGELREGKLERPLAQTWIARRYAAALSPGA
jgi:hypothetical protein